MTGIIKGLNFMELKFIYFMVNGRLLQVIDYFFTCDSFRCVCLGYRKIVYQNRIDREY